MMYAIRLGKDATNDELLETWLLALGRDESWWFWPDAESDFWLVMPGWLPLVPSTGEAE